MQDAADQSAVLNILNDLLDVEVNSVFQFLGDSGTYLDRSTAPIRRPLAEMIAASHRRVDELVQCIDALGGTPIARGLQIEEQNLAYLSLKFLLPRLVGAKELAIARWESVYQLLRDRAPAAASLIEKQLAEHRSHLSILMQAATASRAVLGATHKGKLDAATSR